MPPLNQSVWTRAAAILVGEHEPLSNVPEGVKKIVIEHLGIDEAKVTEDANFIDDLGADSLDFVELVMAFEEEFRCEIPDAAAEKIATVKDAIVFIEALRGGPSITPLITGNAGAAGE